MANDSNEKTKARGENEKEWEEWKENKRKRQDELQEKIEKLEQDIDKVWDDYENDKEEYWKQKHYIDFLKWQNKVRDRKVNDRVYEEKRRAHQEKLKEREKEDNMKKHIAEIELCNFLANYCKALYPQDHKDPQAEKHEDVDVDKKIHEDAQWKKEKGLEVLQSKKSKGDEEPVKKKGKKYKKPREDHPK